MSVRGWWCVVGGVTACAAGSDRAQPVPAAAEETPAAALQCVPELPDVVAEIGGTPVTREQLLEVSKAELVEAEVKLYQARKDAIDALILRRVVEAKAASRGLTIEQLVEVDVTSKQAPVTDAEIEAFYKENQSKMEGSFEQVRPNIAAYLEQERTTESAQVYFKQLREEANAKVLLPPYRIAVDGGDSPRWGSVTAPVQIVEFSDFQCRYCSTAVETMDEVKAKYGDKVSIVYRHFPLPMHRQAHRAAQASECANDQQGFWKFHDALFADQKVWTDDDFVTYARKSGIDADKLLECVTSGRHTATVDSDIAEGRDVGMSGTPGFFVNGVVLTGAQPFDVFADVIDAELARL